MSTPQTVCVCFLVLFGIHTIQACSSCVNPNAVPASYTSHTYTESNAHIENPHRGFMTLLITKSSHHFALTKGELDHYRTRDGLTTVSRLFYLDTFVSSPISSDFLNKIRHDLDVIESAGFTVVMRFAYIDQMLTSHPYGDASRNVALQHISQLGPIFTQYQGIITSVQAGFIGAWGEWHHTEHFNSWADKQAVLDELLKATPTSVQVQLRTPAFKMHMEGTTPATFTDVQTSSNKGRTGHHNDCFLASDDDEGTYSNKATEYPYLQADTRYTVMGGETCATTSNHRHECPTAKQEVAMFHWTYMNEAYNQDVYRVWKSQGCYNEIHRKLGYRLSISRAILPNTGRTDDELCFVLDFDNHGYAAPIKNLQLYLVLQAGNTYYAARVPGVDVRDWQPGQSHSVASAVRLANVPQGDYKVLLQLRDPFKGAIADYNVLLASNNVPVYAAGLNDLGHTIHVSGQQTASSDCPVMATFHLPNHGQYSRVFTPTP